VSDYHFFHSYNHQILWTVGQGIAIMSGNIVYGKGTKFTKYKKGDIVASYDEKEVENQNVFSIQAIVSDTLMVVEDQLKYSDEFDYEGEYLIGTRYNNYSSLIHENPLKNS